MNSLVERLYSAPTGIVVLLSIFYGTISILAIIGNSLVIWVVVTTRQMRTVTNMYIANLAFADVVIGLFCIPFQVKYFCVYLKMILSQINIMLVVKNLS